MKKVGETSFQCLTGNSGSVPVQHVLPLPCQHAQSAPMLTPNLSGEPKTLDLLVQKGEHSQVPLTINTETINKIRSLAPSIPASVLDRKRTPGENNTVVTMGQINVN